MNADQIREKQMRALRQLTENFASVIEELDQIDLPDPSDLEAKGDLLFINGDSGIVSLPKTEKGVKNNGEDKSRLEID